MAQTASPPTASPPTAAPGEKPVRVRFDRFELDEENASLTCEGKAIALPPTPFAVLCALVRLQGALVTKNDLLDKVWGHRYVTESVLKTVIGKLRTALQDDARQPRYIETVSRRGYRFIAPTASVAASGRTQGSAGSQDDAFIGRADALSRLGAAYDRASEGKRSIVWLAGEPGIGKTTLIERFMGTLGEIACVRGQCVEQYGAGEPYLPVLEALGDLCRSDASAVPMLRAVAPTWLVQLPWLTSAEERDALRRELVGVGADRMLREMAEFVERYTERKPLILVTEDLHWSDRATIQLLDYVARRRAPARFLWLSSFRLSEVIAFDHPLNALRRELLLHDLCEEIVLDPFSESEVAQYVSRHSPSFAADEGFVRTLHERTDGLPLFVAHILGDLTQAAPEGEAARAAEQVTSLAVPERLAAIIDHDIARLSDGERSVLSAAAVCGTGFRVDTIAAMLESDPEVVAQTCEGLIRKRMLVPAAPAQEPRTIVPAAYSFRHALFRQVLYERIVPTLRASLHRKAAFALEGERTAGVPVAPVELAMHFERGGDATAAIRHYADAAEAALSYFSPDESIALSERGLALLELAPASPERDSIELSLATLAGASAEHRFGVSSVEAKTWLERAHALLEKVPGHRLRGLLLHLLGFALVTRGEYAEALRLAERTEALSAAADDPILLRAACTMQGQVHMQRGRPAAAREWLERALRVVVPDDFKAEAGLIADPQVTILGLLAVQSLHLGHVELARERSAEARERARASAQPLAELIAIWLEALLEVRLGDAQRVEALAARMDVLVEKFGLAQGRTAARWFHGWALARTGKPAEGARLIRDAYQENTKLGMLSGGSEVVGYAAEAQLLAEDVDAADVELAEAMRIVEKLGERVYLPQLLTIEAAIARARGRRAQSEAALRRAVAEAREQQAPWLELAPLRELCASSGTQQDRDALAALIEAMPEAKDAPPISKARSLRSKA